MTKDQKSLIIDLCRNYELKGCLTERKIRATEGSILRGTLSYKIQTIDSEIKKVEGFLKINEVEIE